MSSTNTQSAEAKREKRLQRRRERERIKREETVCLNTIKIDLDMHTVVSSSHAL